MIRKIMSLLFGLAAVTLFAVCSHSISAQATDPPMPPVSSSDPNTIFVTAERLQENVALNNGATAYAGDFAVRLWIANNTGYAGSGIAIHYDNANYEPIMLSPSAPVDVYYEGGSSVANLGTCVLAMRNKGRIGLTTSGGENNTTSGMMIEVYLRRKANATDPGGYPMVGTSIDELTTSKNVDIVDFEQPTEFIPDPNSTTGGGTFTTCYTTLEYRLGDVNGDGIVNMADANIMTQILSPSSAIGAATAETRANNLSGTYDLSGLFFTDSNNTEVFIFAALDINGSGYLTQADIDQISDFYMAYVLQADPVADMGCVEGIGELHSITIAHVINP